jgi:ribosome maturation factor RimP
MPRGPVRAKTVEDRQVLELLDPVAESLGLTIVRLRLMGGVVRRLQIMAERPADRDITIEQCARLSRACSQVLDAADPIPGEYVLEVSSPGIDRPLTRLEDFEIWAGYEARLELDRLVENRKRFKGILAGIEDDNVAIDLEGEDETALMPFAWIVEAKLVLNDALMKKGAEQRAARLLAGEAEDSDDDEIEDIDLDDDPEDEDSEDRSDPVSVKPSREDKA